MVTKWESISSNLKASQPLPPNFSPPDPLVLPMRPGEKLQNDAQGVKFPQSGLRPISVSFSKDSSQPLEHGFMYACRSWCYHLKEILIFHNGMSYLMSHFEDEILRTQFISCLSSLATDWFQTWASILGQRSDRWEGLKDELDAIISMCPVSLNFLANFYADIELGPR